jgi:hypothetical protein
MEMVNDGKALTRCCCQPIHAEAPLLSLKKLVQLKRDRGGVKNRRELELTEQ